MIEALSHGEATCYRAAMQGRHVVALTLVTCAVASPAFADTEAIALDYKVAAGCPGRARFVEEVRTLTTKAELVEPNAAQREFRVEAQRRGGGVQGKLTIVKAGETSEREVSGTSCAEVVSALALATAIAVDPSILGGEPTPEPPKPEPPAAKPEPPKPEAAPPRQPPSRPEEDRPRQPPRTEPLGNVVFAAGAGVMSAIAPSLATRPALRVGFRPGSERMPEFFLEGAWLIPVSSEHASFSAFLARPGVAWEFWKVGSVALGLVTGVEFGVLEAEGADDIRAPRQEERPWAALDFGPSLRIPADSSFFVRAEGGALFTLYRHEYSIASPTNELEIIHEIPGYGFRASGFAGFFL
jgi:hypothetical protein